MRGYLIPGHINKIIKTLKINQLQSKKSYWNTFWHIGYKINKHEQDSF
ncbi:MAG: hypothetical protein K0R59_1180 [Sphingobacterium sp.]|jgi:hypothetical protein|nr:hypothetical protein [Sphingobacterium sp.]